MPVTEKDLLQQRVEITKEQMDARHEQTDIFQNTLIKIEDSMDKKLDKILLELESMKKEMDNKYASKWAEKVWIWLFWIVGTSLVVALMSLIIIWKK